MRLQITLYSNKGGIFSDRPKFDFGAMLIVEDRRRESFDVRGNCMPDLALKVCEKVCNGSAPGIRTGKALLGENGRGESTITMHCLGDLIEIRARRELGPKELLLFFSSLSRGLGEAGHRVQGG